MHSKFEPQWDYFSNLSRENVAIDSQDGASGVTGYELRWVSSSGAVVINCVILLLIIFCTKWHTLGIKHTQMTFQNMFY